MTVVIPKGIKRFYLLKSRKNFHIWKEKTLSNASSQGFERFLLEDVKVDTDSNIILRRKKRSTLPKMMITLGES